MPWPDSWRAAPAVPLRCKTGLHEVFENNALFSLARARSRRRTSVPHDAGPAQWAACTASKSRSQQKETPLFGRLVQVKSSFACEIDG